MFQPGIFVNLGQKRRGSCGFSQSSKKSCLDFCRWLRALGWILGFSRRCEFFPKSNTWCWGVFLSPSPMRHHMISQKWFSFSQDNWVCTFLCVTRETIIWCSFPLVSNKSNLRLITHNFKMLSMDPKLWSGWAYLSEESAALQLIDSLHK